MTVAKHKMKALFCVSFFTLVQVKRMKHKNESSFILNLDLTFCKCNLCIYTHNAVAGIGQGMCFRNVNGTTILQWMVLIRRY